MGRGIDKQVQEHFESLADPLMQKRIEAIGKKLSAGSDRRDLVYRFRVIRDEGKDNYNAFAVPGGYVYIFEDLVETLETDEKIAAVLAHEMGHVEARHSVKRMQSSIGVTLFMLISSHISGENSDKGKVGNAMTQLMAAYSREDEKQADELSVKYLKRAGFDPDGAVMALETLKKLRKKAPRIRYMIYRSHPYLSERIAHLKKYIQGYTDFDSYINLSPKTE